MSKGASLSFPEAGPGDVKIIYEQWPAAQVRANEIIAAWDRYESDTEAAREISGSKRLGEAVQETVNAMHDLEDRIAHTRAHTNEGRLAKIHMAHDDHVSLIESQLERALEERMSASTIIGLSLILDYLQASNA